MNPAKGKFDPIGCNILPEISREQTLALSGAEVEIINRQFAAMRAENRKLNALIARSARMASLKSHNPEDYFRSTNPGSSDKILRLG